MGKALALAAVLVLLAASTAEAAEGPTGELIADSEAAALRLHDLPPGYLLGATGGCGPLGAVGAPGKPGDAQDRYLRWAFRQLPEACTYLYKRVFEVPGLGPAPPRVEAEIVNTPSEEAAAKGFELISALFDSDPGDDPPLAILSPSGVQIRVFRFRSFRVDGKTGQAGSILLWHHGKLISYLKVTGMSPRGNDRAALHYAQIQQSRMEHPSPYTEAERDDSEVWLDDPALTFPVYWAGNPFQPAGRPPVGLEFAYAGNALPTGGKYELDYFVEGGGFRIEGWTRRGWRRFQRSDPWRSVQADRCIRIKETRLKRGRAVIFGAYRRHPSGPCPRRSPDHYYATAHIGRMVLGINLRTCAICAEAGSSPYDSLRGMKTILRGLTLRPRPVYAAPAP